MPAFADCTAPDAPQNLPDGGSATLQQMLAGKKSVDDFNSATNAYLDCLKKEHQAALDAAGPAISADDKAKLEKTETDKHNAAVDRLTTVANRFNEQVRAYKQKSAKS
jgi:hypothetical protein